MRSLSRTLARGGACARPPAPPHRARARRAASGRGGQDGALAVTDLQHAARALDSCQFRHLIQEQPTRCWATGSWNGPFLAYRSAARRRSIQSAADRDLVSAPRLEAEYQLAQETDGKE